VILLAEESNAGAFLPLSSTSTSNATHEGQRRSQGEKGIALSFGLKSPI
jgi:hypothetical protein